jgi:SpoIIAA-like
MIERIPDLPEHVVGLTAKGKITADDYESVVIPAVEAVLKKRGKIRLLYHIGPDFSGFTPGAFWCDAKVGFKHVSKWEKVAVVSNVGWIRGSTKLWGMVMPGDVKVFSNDQLSEAKEWLTS